MTLPSWPRAMMGQHLPEWRALPMDAKLAHTIPLVCDRHHSHRRRVTGMGKFTEKLKSVLMHHELSDIPAKQIHRWEDEGGALSRLPKRPRRFTRRSRSGDKPVNGGNAV